MSKQKEEKIISMTVAGRRNIFHRTKPSGSRERMEQNIAANSTQVEVK